MLRYVEIARHHQLQSHFVRRAGQTEAHSGFDIRPLGVVIEYPPYLMRLLLGRVECVQRSDIGILLDRDGPSGENCRRRASPGRSRGS